MKKSGVVTALCLSCALGAVEPAEATLGGQLAEFLVRVFKNTDEVPVQQKGATQGSGQGAASNEGPEVGKEELATDQKNMREIDPYLSCIVAADKKMSMSRGNLIIAQGAELTKGKLWKIFDTTSRDYCTEYIACGSLLDEDHILYKYRTADFDSCMWEQKYAPD